MERDRSKPHSGAWNHALDRAVPLRNPTADRHERCHSLTNARLHEMSAPEGMPQRYICCKLAIRSLRVGVSPRTSKKGLVPSRAASLLKLE